MVMQMVQRNMCSSRGQRPSDAHVMQRPVAKSLLPATEDPLRWPRAAGAAAGEGLPLAAGPDPKPSDPESEKPESSPPAPPAAAGRTGLARFLLEKSEGNGWLKERAWRGREERGGLLRGCRSPSDEDESPWRWWFCMVSQTSISVTREVLL